MIDPAALALAVSCMVLDTPARIEGWLLRIGMTPQVTAYSGRIKRQYTIWLDTDDGRYAIVMPQGNRSCVVDMGKGWREVS